MLGNLVFLPKPVKTALIWITDFLIAVISVILALAILFGDIPVQIASLVWVFLVVAMANSFFLFIFGLYRVLIRYIDEKVFISIISAATLSSVVLWISATFLALETIPKSTALIYGLLSTLGILSSRYLAKTLTLKKQFQDKKFIPVAIYGAGQAGSQTAQALAAGSVYKPVLFFDDNFELQGRTINGLPVFSTQDRLSVLDRYNCAQVLLAIPSATRARKREIIEQFDGTSIKLKMLPAVEELVAGQVQLSDIREVGIEDLLGRDPVPPFKGLIEKCIKDKVVLISGAGGSIGSEIARQTALHQPKKIILLDISEFNLYQITHDLHKLHPSLDVVSLLGDVLDQRFMERVLKKYNVHTMYHTAAYKHVPIVEYNSSAGLRNNVLGTASAAQAAVNTRLETFVLISTDKAVRPTNIMGATKRLAELVVQNIGQSSNKTNRTKMSIVRFGNVLGSSGSVVPLFQEQIRNGGPITVTHPDVTRYFMTIPEAAQLVIQAGALGEKSEIFVLDMGEPIKIIELAHKMIVLSGLQVGSDSRDSIEIKVTGLRPGEKLYEELLIGNDVSVTLHPRILKARESYWEPQKVEQCLEEISKICEEGQDDQIKSFIRKWVSEYRPLD